MNTTMPDRSEAAAYYFTYIDRVPAGDVVEHLRGQEAEVVAFARGALARAGRPSLSLGRWARVALARERGSTAFGVEPGLGRSASRAVALRPAASEASSPAPERSDWVPCSPKASPLAVERYLCR